jgi:4-amino-4-deoxy-L-arabinose transferase-like glycosyltransferase
MALLVLWSLGFVIEFAYVAAKTLPYPFSLEWMEGDMLDTVRRVREGQPVYAAPSVGYVPFLYMPLYYWACAGLSLVTGVSFLTARALSVACICVAGFLIYRFVARETSSRVLGLLSTGAFFATFEISGRWFHLARLDSLSLLLLLLPLYLLRFGRSNASAAIAGVAMCLGVLCKQTAIVAYAPVLAVHFWARERRGFVATAVLGACSLASVIALQRASSGWFWYFVVDVPLKHPIESGAWWSFLRTDLLGYGAAIALAGYGLWKSRRDFAGKFYAAMAVGFVTMSLMARIKAGGYINTLIPAYAAFAIAMPLGIAARHRAPIRDDLGWKTYARAFAPIVLLALQFGKLQYAPHSALPEPGALAQGEAYLARLAQIDGEVIGDQRFVQSQVGLKSRGLGMAMMDILRLDAGDRGRRVLVASLTRALEERRFSAIVLLEPGGGLSGIDTLPAFAANYRRLGPIVVGPCPVTGFRTRPQWIYVPRDEPVGESLRLALAPAPPKPCDVR